MIFVLAYDRASDLLETYERFDDEARAQAESRYRLCLQNAMFQGREFMEVNIFESESEAIFKKTHARYFQTTPETINALRSAV